MQIPPIPPNLEQWLSALSAVGAVALFAWGVVVFIASQRQQATTRRIEATKPFLERQLSLYTSVTQAASVLANGYAGNGEYGAAQTAFWRLYWGELALVEDHRVEAAMVEFGRSGRTQDELKVASLNLAHACRDSLAESWGVTQWRRPRALLHRGTQQSQGRKAGIGGSAT